MKCLLFDLQMNLSCKDNTIWFKNSILNRVWIQGYVIAVIDDETIVVDDSTGKITVKIPSIEILLDDHLEKIKLGHYVQVLGSLSVSVNGNNSISLNEIEALTVCGSNNPNMETLWFTEVLLSVSKVF